MFADGPKSAALIGSLLLHGALLGAALFWLPSSAAAPDDSLESIAVSIVSVEVASTEQTSPTRSDAATTSIAAGVRSEAVDTVMPIETEPVRAVTPDAIAAVIEPVAMPVASDAAPVTANPLVAEPIAAVATAQPIAAQGVTAADISNTIPSPPILAVASSAPLDPAPLAPIAAVTRIASVEPKSVASPVAASMANDLSPAGAIVPIPPIQPVTQPPVSPISASAAQPRPQPPAKPKPTAPPPKPTRAKPTPASSGSGGRSTADAQAAAPARGGAGAVDAGGAAASSRYQGLVQARLKRMLRSPTRGGRGQVYVLFTVLADGSVTGIAVTSSSGSPILDAAAADTVRRAAPFPPIPAAVGRASWAMTMPLRFR